jgi:hypothetical protein
MPDESPRTSLPSASPTPTLGARYCGTDVPQSDLSTNLMTEKVVPPGGAADVPLAFEGTSVAELRVYSETAGITAGLAGVALDSYSALPGSVLDKSFTNPSDGSVHISNLGTSEATVSVTVMIITSRQLTMTPSSYIVTQGENLSLELWLSEATESDEASAYLRDPTGSRTPVTLAKLGRGNWTGQVTPTLPGVSWIIAQTGGDRARYESCQVLVDERQGA